MTSPYVVALMAAAAGLGLWLDLRSWAAPRVYFGRRPSLADCVLSQPERVEVSRD
jgi:hypothetical protein